MKYVFRCCVALVAAFALMALTGCNTVKGVGKDFEAMGESMQDAGQ